MKGEKVYARLPSTRTERAECCENQLGYLAFRGSSATPARLIASSRPFAFQIRARWRSTSASVLTQCQPSALALTRARRRAASAAALRVVVVGAMRA